MSAPVIVITGSDVEVVVADTPIVLGTDEPGVTLSLVTSPVVVTTETDEPTVIAVGQQGPAGTPGADPDYVWAIKPDAAFTYDGDGVLTRIDYADGTHKAFTYDGDGNLTQVTGPNADGDTVTKTMTYVDGVLATSSTVVS